MGRGSKRIGGNSTISDLQLGLTAEDRLKVVNILADDLLERRDWESINEVDEVLMKIKELCRL